MSRFRFSCILTMFCLSAVTHAQLSHKFTNTARNIHYGFAYGVVVGSDGTVFIANRKGGLWAYTYDGTSFTGTAYINDGGSAEGVTVALDGTVFLANGDDGLRAYTYDGTSFINTAHIDNGAWAKGLAVASDGTVFLANKNDGLRAYTYDGTSFTGTAHIDESGEANGVEVASDGTVFLANHYKGMFAYTYSASSGIDNNLSTIPENYSLSQNYPNPFNPSTTIYYVLKKSARVSLRIYNLLGRGIKILVDSHQSPGTYSVRFEASDLTSGIYYYQLQINNEVFETKKMVLLR